MNILSIDWDYFFPDNIEFDWAMDESRFLFYETIWPFRYSNMHLRTKQLAKDIYHPDQQLLNGFLNKVLINSNPSILSIADSHTDIQHLINLFPAKVNIYNFDQHHDIYYYDTIPSKMKLNCGNWVSYFRNQIKEYHIIYPPWRKDKPEHNDNRLNFSKSISFDIPEQLPNFDMVFVCRSSPWTPSWSDHNWIEFIEYFKINYPNEWKHKIALDYALKPRSFNQDEAEIILEQMRELIKQTQNRKGGDNND